MITVSEAKDLISQHVKPLKAIQISLGEAAGHLLAQDVYAAQHIPAFRQSSMDGYAFKFDEHQQPLPIVGEMAAGSTSAFTLQSRTACRIFTGAPLPEGADTVVMQEKTSIEDGLLLIQDDQLKLAANVREAGAEARKGALAMRKGDFLSPAAVGFLAGIGINTLQVFPMPKISIIVTGRELQQPGQALQFGQVYESNSYALSAALQMEGIKGISVYEADDDLEVLTTILQQSLDQSDVVLLSGGVSVGDYDFVIEASQACGVSQVFHKVKQKPGKPLFFGTRAEKLIFGLPGNPSSVLSCYYNYVLPAIKQLSQKENSSVTLEAKLKTPYRKPAGLTHYLKGWYENGLVMPLDAQESFRLSSFAQANCLICLEESGTEFPAESPVNIIRLPF